MLLALFSHFQFDASPDLNIEMRTSRDGSGCIGTISVEKNRFLCQEGIQNFRCKFQNFRTQAANDKQALSMGTELFLVKNLSEEITDSFVNSDKLEKLRRELLH